MSKSEYTVTIFEDKNGLNSTPLTVPDYTVTKEGSTEANKVTFINDTPYTVYLTGNKNWDEYFNKNNFTFSEKSTPKSSVTFNLKLNKDLSPTDSTNVFFDLSLTAPAPGSGGLDGDSPTLIVVTGP